MPMNKLKSTIACLSLTILALIAGCSKSNVPPPTPLKETVPEKVNVKVKWETETGNGNGELGNYNLAPSYNKNSVFVPNQNGQIFALSMKNGKVIWSKNLSTKGSFIWNIDALKSGNIWKDGVETNLSSQPIVTANAVIFGTIKGDLIALDVKNGKLLWHSNAQGSLFSQPTVYDDSIYTNAHNGAITAFNLKNGSIKWSASNCTPNLTLPNDSSPIIVNNVVIVGTAFGTVVGYNKKSGDRTINMPIAITHGSTPADRMVDITATPMLYKNFVILATYQGDIVAIAKNNGKMLWAKKSSIIDNMAIDNNTIFTTQDNSSLKAFNIDNGKTLWESNILNWRKITGPIYYKGMVVVADYQGYLHFFDSKNGNYLGRFKLTPKSRIFNHGISAQLVPTKNGILVEAEDGTTYLVDAYSNNIKYKSILGDYKIDKGTPIDHISPVKPIKSKTSKTSKKQESKNTTDSKESKSQSSKSKSNAVENSQNGKSSTTDNKKDDNTQKKSVSKDTTKTLQQTKDRSVTNNTKDSKDTKDKSKNNKKVLLDKQSQDSKVQASKTKDNESVDNNHKNNTTNNHNTNNVQSN